MRQFVVIGCGRFGSSVAKTLYSLGYDVLAIDKDEERVQELSDSVTHAVQSDAVDENALRTIGIRNFDVAIVTIGSDIQASIMGTLIAKELGVNTVIAKAQSDLHAKVLYKIGADRVVFPERDMGVRVAHNLVSSNILDVIELAPDYSIVEIAAMEQWENKTLRELQLPNRYGISVMAIKHGEDINISPYADDVIKEDDVLIVMGNNKDLKKLERKR
ncbi:potassium channel family protein [Caldisalinibacter kiritimatiensis]|uniref:Potassium uptake protein, integral membrane component, KtrA n=1 Tax=Caldisalinibacter kiritimatiensis TaxID=1304284 RepID=R1CF45_9FIRM|nr:TrkA family potassium uptake protein [Caldisalinibacter kiritimatiensis]EOD00920.1 Potassium uptake protein, integral membrane component, KtrA [Caldisalinibacter kiritimatiensis]